MELVLVACPVCGSERSRHKFDMRDYVLRTTDDSFGVRQCRDCGAGFLSPRPKRSDIAKFYSQDFYWSYETVTSSPLTSEDLLRSRGPQIAGKLRRMAHLKPGALLDIGAMKGEFLHAARERGWKVEGVEFTDHLPNPFEVPVRYGEFLDMDIAPRSIDCVTMWAVLEHVYDPSPYVHRIAELLRNGGTFIGVVTNFNSVQARLLRGDDSPRHLTMFTKRSLNLLLRGAGLSTVRIWTDQELFGGRLRGAGVYAIKRLVGYTADEALYEMRDRRDPEAFCCKFRGRPSRIMKWLSRIDSAALWLPEHLLDIAGCGFNLGFEARKAGPPT